MHKRVQKSHISCFYTDKLYFSAHSILPLHSWVHTQNHIVLMHQSKPGLYGAVDRGAQRGLSAMFLPQHHPHSAG